MIISGGQAKGIPLEVPKGIEIRPSTQANRESLFSSLGERILELISWIYLPELDHTGLKHLVEGQKVGILWKKIKKGNSIN